jgi:hypothetical protein
MSGSSFGTGTQGYDREKEGQPYSKWPALFHGKPPSIFCWHCGSEMAIDDSPAQAGPGPFEDRIVLCSTCGCQTTYCVWRRMEGGCGHVTK